MDREEIIRYIETSRNKSVIVERSLLDEYRQYVREIVITKEDTIRIEFNTYNQEYGGLTFFFKYLNFDMLISSLEKYLNKEVKNWENISKTGYYPFLDEKPDKNESERDLEEDFISDNIKLPDNYVEKILPDGYWKTLYCESH